MRSYQHGVGLVEVLVALVLLSIAVLGFVALQLRAVAASHEAGRNIQAMNIARDLSERIRTNRDGLLEYKKAASTENCASDTGENGKPGYSAGKFCTANEMAAYDYMQVSSKAADLGMNIDILDCQGAASLKRKCIYVAWGGTTPTNGTASPNCTNRTAYLPEAKCIIVEVYNYAE